MVPPEGVGSPRITGQDLAATVRHKLSRLSALLDDLRRDIHVYGPREFGGALHLIVEGIRRSFEQEVEDLSARNASDLTLYKLSQAYLAHVRVLHQRLLPYVQKVDTSYIPVEILMVLRRLSRFLSPRVSLSLLPQWEYMYKFIGYPNLVTRWLENFPAGISKIAGQAEKLPEWLVFIAFPYVESKNVLLHILMVHEVGHLKDFVDGISSSALERTTVDSERLGALVRNIRETPIEKPQPPRGGPQAVEPTQLTLDDLYGDVIYQQVYERVSTIVSNWVKEFVADLIAIRALGPAFFFALAEMSATVGVLDKHGDTHPSSKLRLKYLLAELQEMGFLSETAMPEIVERLAAWKQDLEEQNLTPSESHQEIAFVTTATNFGVIREAVLNAPNLYTYRVEIFNRDVSSIVNHLSRGIPPSEKVDGGKKIPLNLVSIINSLMKNPSVWTASSDRKGEGHTV